MIARTPIAALHDRAAPEHKATSLVALVFAALFAGLTCAVHFVELTAARQTGTVGPLVGHMRLQLVGVFGYAAVLPVMCVLLARMFGRTR